MSCPCTICHQVADITCVQLALLPLKGWGSRAVQVLASAACAEPGSQAQLLTALVEPHHLAALSHMACGHPLYAPSLRWLLSRR